MKKILNTPKTPIFLGISQTVFLNINQYFTIKIRPVLFLMSYMTSEHTSLLLPAILAVVFVTSPPDFFYLGIGVFSLCSTFILSSYKSKYIVFLFICITAPRSKITFISKSSLTKETSKCSMSLQSILSSVAAENHLN